MRGVSHTADQEHVWQWIHIVLIHSKVGAHCHRDRSLRRARRQHGQLHAQHRLLKELVLTRVRQLDLPGDLLDALQGARLRAVLYYSAVRQGPRNLGCDSGRDTRVA